MLLLAYDRQVLPLGSNSGSELPLGAALVCCLDASILEGVAAAFHEHARSPWCPLVLASHVAVREETLVGLRPDVGRLTTIRLEPETASPTYDEVRAAIGQRGPPSTADVVEYVKRRTHDDLADAVARALEGRGAWSSGLRRRLGARRAPSPQHWLNLFQLATYLSAADYPVSRTLEQIALDSDRAPRTVSVWCAKYLGCGWPEARSRLGWEWVIETAVRADGNSGREHTDKLPRSCGPRDDGTFHFSVLRRGGQGVRRPSFGAERRR
jgi:hypothetical protein